MICLNSGMATLVAGVVAAPLMRVLPKWCFENVVLLEPGICRNFQLGRILEEIAYLKKNICHCGKHARDRCQALPSCTIGAQQRRQVRASCRILVK
jgi:hypothetical protein